MARRSEVDVLVAGAGPVGMLAALDLAKRGYSVRIIDRAEHANQGSFALALHPSVLRMLEERHLAPRLHKRAKVVQRVIFRERDVACAEADLSSLDAANPYALVLPQGDLETVLLDGLKEAGVEVEWGHELRMINQEVQGVTARMVRLEDRPQGYAVSDMRRMGTEESTVKARFLVGADGAESTVRRLIGVSTVSHGRMRHYSAFEFEMDEKAPAELQVVFHGGMINSFWPMTNGRVRWSFQIDPDRSTLPPPSDLQCLLRERAPWFPEGKYNLRWHARVSFGSWQVARFAAGRIFLAGDAAHQTSPIGVQSMNGGLLEAAYIGSLIEGADPRKDIDRAAQEYHDARHAYWTWLLDPQQRTGHTRSDDAWIDRHAEDILSSLPASGQYLRELFLAVRPSGTRNTARV